MTREELQEEGVKLSEKLPYIVYEYSTGVGKSLVAIKIIEKYGGIWNIVLAETNHENNWIEEFKKHGKEHLLSNIKFFCYQSLHKYLEGENYIFDEVHHVCSQLRLEWLLKIRKNNLKRFIGLSATLTRTQKEEIQTSLGSLYIHKFTLSEAIESNILPAPIIYFVETELDTVIKNCIYKFNKDKQVKCTERVKYNMMSERIEYLKNRYFLSYEQHHKIQWLKAANDRKKFLSECKTKHARTLLTILQNKRLICFTGSIKQSEELSNGLSIHSEISKGGRAELIQKFNSGEINQLFATAMLKEGINLSNIEVGIIVQLDNQLRYSTQIIGRTLRAVYPEQYILYVKDTQDEVYVNTAIEDFNKEYIKFTTLNKIKI